MGHNDQWLARGRDRRRSALSRAVERELHIDELTFSDWSTLAAAYAAVSEPSRRTAVFGLSRDLLQERNAKTLLDYGGGDGAFAKSCLGLGLDRITVFEPSAGFAEMARRNIGADGRISVFQRWVDVRGLRFDAVTMHAVWMCLKTEDECVEVLDSIGGTLNAGGTLIAAVTHPCFRESGFSSYKSDFLNEDYLDDGQRYRVTMTDGDHSIRFVDTHWTLGAMSRQLECAGFVIERLFELPDATGKPKGCPWLTFVAKKRKR